MEINLINEEVTFEGRIRINGTDYFKKIRMPGDTFLSLLDNDPQKLKQIIRLQISSNLMEIIQEKIKIDFKVLDEIIERKKKEDDEINNMKPFEIFYYLHHFVEIFNNKNKWDEDEI